MQCPKGLQLRDQMSSVKVSLNSHPVLLALPTHLCNPPFPPYPPPPPPPERIKASERVG